MKKIFALPLFKPFHISASSFVVGVSTVFIIVWGYTGINKLYAPHKFAATMKDVKFMRPFADFLSYFVPIFELLLCLFLVFSFVTIGKTDINTRKIGLYVSAIFIFALTVYVGLMIAMYEHLPCRCGGVVEWLSWRNHLYLNIGLLLLAIAAIVVMKKNKYSKYY
ncbi:MAG: hypothetical protein BGO09_02950 [Bacteroidetes bacterium 47-18]|nr:MAG: hypothetical protein BGO09_02950 [Bacteroidetes bacterium 47-18]